MSSMCIPPENTHESRTRLATKVDSMLDSGGEGRPGVNEGGGNLHGIDHRSEVAPWSGR